MTNARHIYITAFALLLAILACTPPDITINGVDLDTAADSLAMTLEAQEQNQLGSDSGDTTGDDSQPGVPTSPDTPDLIMRQLLARYDGATNRGTFEITVCNLNLAPASPFSAVIRANGYEQGLSYDASLASGECVGLYDPSSSFATFGITQPGEYEVHAEVLPADPGDASANNDTRSNFILEKLDTTLTPQMQALYDGCRTQYTHDQCIQYTVTNPVAEPHEIMKQWLGYIAIYPAQYDALASLAIADNALCAQNMETYLGIYAPNPIVDRGVISEFFFGQHSMANGILSGAPVDGYQNLMDRVPELWEAAHMGECRNAHEMTHLFLGDVPMPPWLNEGLATIMESTERSGYYRPLNHECREYGWFGPDYEGVTREVPYQNLMVFDNSIPGIYYYYTGSCFWIYLEQNYGLDAIQQILQQTVSYRNPVYNACSQERLSTYFIQDIVNPILGTDISPVTLEKWGFGALYTGCE